jgi:hypothetical protein
MSKSINASANGVFIQLTTRKGIVTGQVSKNKHGYAVRLTSSTYPLTAKQKEQIRNNLRDWFFHKHAGQFDHFL